MTYRIENIAPYWGNSNRLEECPYYAQGEACFLGRLIP